MKTLTLDPTNKLPPTRDGKGHLSTSLPNANKVHVHPHNAEATGKENAGVFFIGNATTVIEYAGTRILTDPNFLHAGDHVHLGPGVSATRLKNPAIDLHDLPHIDAILLSHYHEDHFDKEVEKSLRRDVPIITTPHAKQCLTGKGPGENFTNIHALEFWESCMVNIAEGQEGGNPHGGVTLHRGEKKRPGIKVTGMPGKHVPPGPLATANDLLGAVPPTNGWMIELGHFTHLEPSDTTSSTSPVGEAEGFTCGYRIYISGDTLLVDELKEIPERYNTKGQGIDLMLVHLGGTTIPGPSMPLLMVTMDGEMGVKLMQLVKPDVTIPIHFE